MDVPVSGAALRPTVLRTGYTCRVAPPDRGVTRGGGHDGGRSKQRPYRMALGVP